MAIGFRYSPYYNLAVIRAKGFTLVFLFCLTYCRVFAVRCIINSGSIIWIDDFDFVFACINKIRRNIFKIPLRITPSIIINTNNTSSPIITIVCCVSAIELIYVIGCWIKIPSRFLFRTDIYRPRKRAGNAK